MDFNYTNTTLDDYGDVTQYDEYKAALYINRYYFRIIAGVGIPTNILTIITVLSMKPMTSPSLYIIFLAFADVLQMTVQLPYMELTRARLSLGDWMCRLFLFLQTSCNMIPNWILVSMTIERFIAVCYPLRASLYCTKRNATIAVVCICQFIFVINLHFLWDYRELITPERPYCIADSKYAYFFTKIWYWIDGAFFAFIPCILIFICNGMIIFGLRRARQLQVSMVTDETAVSKAKTKQQSQITAMLIAVSIVFLLLILPNAIFHIVVVYWDYEELPRQKALYFLIYNVVFLLSDLNHAINFFLYFLTVTKFRMKCLDIFVFCKRSSFVPFYRRASISISNTNNPIAVPYVSTEPKELTTPVGTTYV